MSAVDVLMTLLPFAVLGWAFTGRGITGRGHVQVMMATLFVYIGYWHGLTAVLMAIGAVAIIQYLSLRRHRLPVAFTERAAPAELRDFRSSGHVAELAEAIGFSGLIDHGVDTGTARFESKTFTDGAGTYLSFTRTTLKTGHGDIIWMRSFLPAGATIASTDDVRLLDFAVPFQQNRMKPLRSLADLYAYHRAGVAAQASQPLVLSASDVLARLNEDEVNRLSFGCKKGFLRRDGDCYRMTLRSAMQAFLDSLNPARPLASERIVGGLEPSDRHIAP